MLAFLLGLSLAAAPTGPGAWAAYRGPTLPPDAHLVGRVQGADLLFIQSRDLKAPTDAQRLPGDGPFFTGRLLVKPAGAADMSDLAEKVGARYVRPAGPSGWHIFDAPNNAGAIARRLRKMPEVRHVHRDRLLQLETQAPTDNIYFHWQWHLRNTEQRDDLPVMTAGADIRAVEAWEITTGSPDIVIAVLDTGVEEEHPDFAGKIVAPFNAGTHELSATPHGDDPEAAHGTMVAGLAAASGDGTTGVVGVCPDCSLLPVWMLGAEGFSADVTVVDAYTHITEQGAQVVNNSWGYPAGPVPLPVHDAMMAYTKESRGGLGGVIVWAIGNTYLEINPLNIAADPRSLAVGGTGADDRRVDYSTFGPPLDVMAPTGHVGDTFPVNSPQLVTTDLLGDDRGFNLPVDQDRDPALSLQGDWTVAMNGTSGAAPIVAGLAGLLLSVDPTLTYEQVFDLVKKSTDQVGDVTYDDNGWHEQYGFGRVNAEGALLRLLAGELCIPSAEDCNDGADNDCDGRADGLDEDCGFVLPGPEGPTGERCPENECSENMFCIDDPLFDYGICSWRCFHDGRCPGACADFDGTFGEGLDGLQLCLASCGTNDECPFGSFCTEPAWACVPPCAVDAQCPVGFRCEEQRCVDGEIPEPPDAGPLPTVDAGSPSGGDAGTPTTEYGELTREPPERVRVQPASCAGVQGGWPLWAALVLLSRRPRRRRSATARGP